jgi:hypothetical protein
MNVVVLFVPIDFAVGKFMIVESFILRLFLFRL